MGARLVGAATNVRLWFSITGEPAVFKGDADQDRPCAVPDVPR